MRKLKSALLVSAALLAFTPVADAQVAVQQSPTHLDAATVVCTYAASPVAINQQETVTCTPPAGMYVYVTAVSFDACTNGSGSAVNQVTWTSTNITGAPVWSFSMAATASICQHWTDSIPGGLKSTAAGTAVTFVSPAAAASNSYHMRAYAYYGN